MAILFWLDRTPVLPQKRRNMSAVAGLMISMACLVPTLALACTGQHNAGAAINLTINGWANAAADTQIGNWTNMGAPQFLTGCTPGDVVPFDLTPSLMGLQYERNVMMDGLSYPAYGLVGYPASPLLIFRHVNWDGDPITPDNFMPVDITKPNHVPSRGHATNQRGSIIRMAAVARGGVMESVPATTLGPIAHVSPLFPGFVKTDTFAFTANLTLPTCTFSDKDVTLPAVYAGDLPNAGSDTGPRDFEVVMDCNGRFALDLTLTDAHAPGASGSLLSPTAQATAAGVRVQLLREGTPVQLGVPWPIAQTQPGTQNIALAARYHRIAGDFAPGAVEGQAILTATYR